MRAPVLGWLSEVSIGMRIRSTRILTRMAIARLKEQGLTQRQCAELMGGPAAFHRFCELARGKRTADSWELRRLRELTGLGPAKSITPRVRHE